MRWCVWKYFKIKQQDLNIKHKCETWQNLKPTMQSKFINVSIGRIYRNFGLFGEYQVCMSFKKKTESLSHCFLLFSSLFIFVCLFCFCLVFVNCFHMYYIMSWVSLPVFDVSIQLLPVLSNPILSWKQGCLWIHINGEVESWGLQLALLQRAGIQEWCLVVFSGWERCHLASIVRWSCHQFLHAGKERSSSVSCG